MRQRQQQQQWQQQPQQRASSPRFLWVMLILIASLAAIYFYVIPFLATMGGESTGSAFSGGWSASQQRQIAFTLAQRI